MLHNLHSATANLSRCIAARIRLTMSPMKTLMRFNTWLRERFGCRAQRVALHTGLSCPVRDGTLATGGCIYCNNLAFNRGAAEPPLPLAVQLREGMSAARRRYKAQQFIAYFQTYTATHGPIAAVSAQWEEALAQPGVVGLAVGARPDTLPPPVVEFLARLAERTMVWIEIGVQSTHDNSLQWMERGHDWPAARQALRNCRDAGLLVAAHMILGLPGENTSAARDSGARLAEAGIHGVKLHHLHAVRGTKLGELYLASRWLPVTAGEYADQAAALLGELADGTVVLRLSGDCLPELLLAPEWGTDKQQVEQMIVDRLSAASVTLR